MITHDSAHNKERKLVVWSCAEPLDREKPACPYEATPTIGGSLVIKLDSTAPRAACPPEAIPHLRRHTRLKNQRLNSSQNTSLNSAPRKLPCVGTLGGTHVGLACVPGWLQHALNEKAL